MSPVIIGNRLKALMTIRNIKRIYLAKELGISYNTLTKKLNGQREFNITELWQIKEALNLDNKLCVDVFFNDNLFISLEEDKDYLQK